LHIWSRAADESVVRHPQAAAETSTAAKILLLGD
jgi:hypothetical protein